jgi:hypothetical protein
MSLPLVPCAACQRHIRVSEALCPFCGVSLGAAERAVKPPTLPRKRIGSLAVVAFRTTALGAVIAACGANTGEPTDDNPDGGADAGAGSSGIGGSNATGTGGSRPDDNIGGSTARGGSPGSGGGGAPGIGGSAPYDGGPVPIYRATPKS